MPITEVPYRLLPALFLSYLILSYLILSYHQYHGLQDRLKINAFFTKNAVEDMRQNDFHISVPCSDLLT